MVYMKKVCKKCGKEKPLEEFYNCKTSKDGKESGCKNCRNKCNKTYRDTHKEEVVERGRKYRLNNKEKEVKRVKLYADNNKEKTKVRCAEWYENNKEHVLKRSRKWKQDNKKQKLETDRKWRQNNPNKSNAIRKRMRDKRKRNFGYVEVNDRKPGDVGHHVTRDLVVYIPEYVHTSIPHGQDDLESMNQINELAMQYV